MARAMWNDVVIAETDRWELVEGNVYFPPGTVKREYLRPSAHTSVCPWKGIAHYYDVAVGGQVNPAAAWFYPDPKPAAAGIKDHVGFWKGIRVEK
ncbi:MAG: DUF427 domain-containing protein [Rhodospirillales bacterium]|nr:DUF427 domain-containing protein [Rhodospirillales bacterium]